MSAVGKDNAHQRIAGLEQREVHGQVGVRAGVGLHVGELATKEFRCAIDGQLLSPIVIDAAGIVPFAWISLGILVGHPRARSVHYSGADVILTGDQFDCVGLALGFVGEQRRDFGIVFVQESKQALRQCVQGRRGSCRLGSHSDSVRRVARLAQSCTRDRYHKASRKSG